MDGCGGVVRLVQRWGECLRVWVWFCCWLEEGVGFGVDKLLDFWPRGVLVLLHFAWLVIFYFHRRLDVVM
jgi:hypothetical protein